MFLRYRLDIIDNSSCVDLSVSYLHNSYFTASLHNYDCPAATPPRQLVMFSCKILSWIFCLSVALHVRKQVYS